MFSLLKAKKKKKKNLWNYFFPNSSCTKKNSLDPNHFFSQAQLTFGSYTKMHPIFERYAFGSQPKKFNLHKITFKFTS